MPQTKNLRHSFVGIKKSCYLCNMECKSLHSVRDMNEILKQAHPHILTLCRKHRVKDLYVFGSVLTPHFSEKSDVDFLVAFNTDEIPDYFTNYFDLKYGLEDAIGRDVDLVEEKAIRNPVFKQNIDKTKMKIYG